MIDHREIVSAQIIVLREQLAQAQAATAAATPVETIEPTFLTQGKIVMVVGNIAHRSSCALHSVCDTDPFCDKRPYTCRVDVPEGP